MSLASILTPSCPCALGLCIEKNELPHFFQWKTGEQDHCLGFSQVRGAWTFTALYLC